MFRSLIQHTSSGGTGKDGSRTLVAHWTTRCVKGSVSFNPLAFTRDPPYVTAAKLNEGLIFANSLWHCVYRICGVISVKNSATFYHVGVLLPRKCKLIFLEFLIGSGNESKTLSLSDQSLEGSCWRCRPGERERGLEVQGGEMWVEECGGWRREKSIVPRLRLEKPVLWFRASYISKWKHQLDATILSILFHLILLSTCFGCYTHPSSGASNMYNQVWYNLITV